MMQDWVDVLAQLRHYEDLRREMERYRYIRRALAGHKKHGRFYSRALIWLGQRLVVWGRHLQEHYGAPAMPCAPGCASHLVSQ